MPEMSSSENVSTKRLRIAELAKQSPQMAFTSLNHHLDVDWLRAAFYRTRKDGAVGVDGQTWKQYEANLEDNLRSLQDRAKSGTYRAPPVRRVKIPKGTSGEFRPIGIPTLEDKILQRAVVMLLEPIYEEDFLDGSYGFRPGRSAHQALSALWQGATRTAGCWILEVDVRKYFDTLDHRHLRELLSIRVRDGVILRLIGKWLKAGIMEDGRLSYPSSGSPQGGVVSPILANVYLHYVLDVWFETMVRPRLRGTAFLVRYADDFVVGFTHEEDARRVTEVLPKRFAKYGLTVHPTKTRLVPFRRPSPGSGPARSPRPGSFDFLGFTHHWRRSRHGKWTIYRKTASSRFTRSVTTLAQWCRSHRHLPIRQQHSTLCQKLVGHYAYYGVTGNYESLSRFYHETRLRWAKWLRRRGGKRRRTWAWFNHLVANQFPLPRPRIYHRA